MATVEQLLEILKGKDWRNKLKEEKVVKKKVVRRRRRKMTFRDTMPTRAREIKQAYIDLLESQLAHLEQRLGNYTVSNDNTKMMKQEIKRLKTNLKKEIKSLNNGVPVAFSTRQPSVRIR